MIRVLYRWRLHPGAEDRFLRAWSTMTEIIRRTTPGALGSLLLRSQDDPQIFTGVARWRSRDHWDAFQRGPSADPEAGRVMSEAIADRLSTEIQEELADLVIAGEDPPERAEGKEEDREPRLRPVGVVRSSRRQAVDDGWDAEESAIELDPGLPEEALLGLADFSHVEVVYLFHLVSDAQIERGARHPRGNRDWPRVGIFAQRGKNRPNRLGVTVCRVLSVEGRRVHLSGLDAINGTPVLDIKPWMREFGPRGDVKQPSWADELMKDYWG